MNAPLLNQYDLDSILRKLYYANGEKEVLLTKEESGELQNYLEELSYYIEGLNRQNMALKLQLKPNIFNKIKHMIGIKGI
jgi:hypothetical protein